MKLHKTLVHAVAETLYRIFTEGIYADKAIEQALKKDSRWGSRDRRFIAETTYEIVRWKRLIMHCADITTLDNIEKVYVLLGTWFTIKNEELPEWLEFATINKFKIEELNKSGNAIRKIRESIPDWLDEIGSSELTERVWEKEIHELNETAHVVLRVNTLKTNRIQLQQLLSEQSIETSIIGDYYNALMLTKRQNILQLAEFKQGFFEIQDASSQLIAPFMDLEPNLTVIDACAGAGGKSLHIAAEMKNSGKIISMDVEEFKLKELKKRADRAGVSIIKSEVINANTINKYKNAADRLLLDVPCSGLGVLRRNPGAKWKLTSEFIERIKITQQEILSNYSQMVKSGGLLIYATCSILPGENQNQINTFLKKNSNFEFLEDRKVLPSEGFDGFYMAKLKKN